MKTLTSIPEKKSFEKMLIDRSIDAIIALNKDYKVIAWNNTASVIYGIAKEDAIDKFIFDIIPDLCEDQETINAIRQASFGKSSFVPASKHFAYRKHVENHYIPLEDDSEKMVGVMNIGHDVAHRIKAEQKLQRLNDELEIRLRQLEVTADELATFTYMSSNKIKDPIRHLYTGIEHLIKTEAQNLSNSGRATFRRMQSSLSRMDLLLDDILSLSQISILQKADDAVNLDELVKEAEEIIKSKTDKTVHFETHHLGSIKGNKTYLQLLLLNLFGNAVKFNQKNEVCIKVNCANVFLNDEMHEAYAEVEYYKLTIEDNGIGIEENDRERIFRMFERLHDKEYKGSGIGLTIVQKIMNAHGGFVQVESVPGGGSAFSCFFPVQKN